MSSWAPTRRTSACAVPLPIRRRAGSDLLAWMHQEGYTDAHVCLEATAPSSDALALFLHEQVVRISRLLGPRCVEKDRLSKQGSPLARKRLFLCALVAMRSDPDRKRWVTELRPKGKTDR